jgi:hypothetical protein
MSLSTFRFAGASELVGTEQRRDHVDGDHHDGSAVDQLDEHGSDPAQGDSVEGEEAKNGEAAGDVDEVEDRCGHDGLFRATARLSVRPVEYPAASDQISTGKAR